MTVYAWGYGDVLENILRGIAWLFDPSGGLMVMLGKITILIGFIAVLLSYFGGLWTERPFEDFEVLCACHRCLDAFYANKDHRSDR